MGEGTGGTDGGVDALAGRTAAELDTSSGCMPRIALYAGSFDPVTNGHLDVVRQAARLADRLVLAIGIHPGRRRFLPQKSAWTCWPNAASRSPRETGCEIGYLTFDDLVVRAAQREGATVMIRGARVTARTSITRCRWPA